MSQISDNLNGIRERMLYSAERSGRTPTDVALVVVTKTVGPEKIREAVEAGATHIGENRVQEAEAKFSPVAGSPSGETVSRQGLTLHMIGALQRNKARRAAELFDYVHAIDRPELLPLLDRGAHESGKVLPVLLEVNTTGEEAKSGVMPQNLARLADALAVCEHLRGMGLMTVARMGAGEVELRRTFSGLRDMLEQLKQTHARAGEWKHLSMGMSDDYQIAIEEGSTMVRLGRAVFGERK